MAAVRSCQRGSEVARLSCVRLYRGYIGFFYWGYIGYIYIYILLFKVFRDAQREIPLHDRKFCFMSHRLSYLSLHSWEAMSSQPLLITQTSA